MTRRDLLQRLLGLVVIGKAIPAQPVEQYMASYVDGHPLSLWQMQVVIDRHVPRDMMLICPQSVKDAYERLVQCDK